MELQSVDSRTAVLRVPRRSYKLHPTAITLDLLEKLLGAARRHLPWVEASPVARNAWQDHFFYSDAIVVISACFRSFVFQPLLGVVKVYLRLPDHFPVVFLDIHHQFEASEHPSNNDYVNRVIFEASRVCWARKLLTIPCCSQRALHFFALNAQSYVRYLHAIYIYDMHTFKDIRSEASSLVSSTSFCYYRRMKAEG